MKPTQKRLLYLLMMSGMILCNCTAVFSQKDTLRAVPLSKSVSVNPNKTESGQSNSFNNASELAQRLAAELASAGIQVGQNEVNDLVQGITSGGQGAMALALSIVQSIADVKAQQPKQGNTGSQTTKVKLTYTQIDNMLIISEKDSTLWISKYLKEKFNQLKISR